MISIFIVSFFPGMYLAVCALVAFGFVFSKVTFVVRLVCFAMGLLTLGALPRILSITFLGDFRCPWIFHHILVGVPFIALVVSAIRWLDFRLVSLSQAVDDMQIERTTGKSLDGWLHYFNAQEGSTWTPGTIVARLRTFGVQDADAIQVARSVMIASGRCDSGTNRYERSIACLINLCRPEVWNSAGATIISSTMDARLCMYCVLEHGPSLVIRYRTKHARVVDCVGARWRIEYPRDCPSSDFTIDTQDTMDSLAFVVTFNCELLLRTEAERLGEFRQSEEQSSGSVFVLLCGNEFGTFCCFGNVLPSSKRLSIHPSESRCTPSDCMKQESPSTMTV
jgi:hypothetical protein